MASVLKVDTLQKPDGSTPTAADLGLDVAGSVVQVVHGTTNVAVGNSTNSPVNTGLSATITPKYNTSKILVLVNHSDCRVTSVGVDWDMRIMRNGVSQKVFDNYFLWNSGGNLHASVIVQFMDSPSTTSSLTYSTQFWTGNGSGAGTAYAQADNQESQITLLEIAQ
jgi:hypothetical protein